VAEDISWGGIDWGGTIFQKDSHFIVEERVEKLQNNHVDPGRQIAGGEEKGFGAAGQFLHGKG